MNERPAGFTLIEVVVAIVVVGILAGGLLSSWGTLVKQSTQPDQLARMQDIAAATLDANLSQSHAASYGTITASGPALATSGYYVQVTVTPVSVNSLAGKHVTVQVSANCAGCAPSVSYAGDAYAWQ